MSRTTRVKSALAAIGTLAVVAFVVGGAVTAGNATLMWTQWGGRNEDFIAHSKGLAEEWPADGPRELWSRELGDGYSAILVEGNRLYTMYRVGDQESVICLGAKNGETIWEHRYDHSPHEGHVQQFGTGPRSTPLLSGEQLFTIGVAGKMHALNKKTGEVLWSHDLWEEFGGNKLQHGYASSPVEYKNTVITLVGGEDQSIVAFNKKDGSVAWKNLSFENSYSTPRLLDVDGEQQLVTFMAKEIIGVDPDDGELKWRYPHENQSRQNVNMPVMADANHLFLSSPSTGARGLKLTRNGDKTEVEEIWSTRKIQFYHVTSVRHGDFVYGSTGTRAPAFDR
jgi:outer membrane protein assembly factor BamB